jgi:hypothetical protein
MLELALAMSFVMASYRASPSIKISHDVIPSAVAASLRVGSGAVDDGESQRWLEPDPGVSAEDAGTVPDGAP